MPIKTHRPIATILTTCYLLLSQTTPSLVEPLETRIATLTETLKFQTYDVKISPKQSLHNAINQASPIRQDGQTFHGLTTWMVYPNPRWQSDSTGQCRITTITTQLTTTILLPKLIGGTATQRQQFARFLPLLRNHELNHHAFGKQAAIAINRSLSTLPIAPNCSTLDRRVRSSVSQLLTTSQLRDKAYDVKTNHGQTEGLFLLN
jgi:predicted secreted Zn-dependent protease